MIAMITAQLLVLRRRRALMIATFGGSFAVAVAIVVGRFFLNRDSVGGLAGLDAVGLGLGAVAIIVGVLIGTSAGTADTGSGVIRDHIAAGASRPRLALARVPAAVVIAVAALVPASIVALVTGYLVPGGEAPMTGHAVRVVLGVFATTAIVAAIATGISGLLRSSNIATALLLGWLFVAESLLVIGVLSVKALPDQLVAASITTDISRLLGAETSPEDPSVLPIGVAAAGLVAWVAVSVGASVVRTVRSEW